MDAEHLFTHWIGLAARKNELLAQLESQIPARHVACSSVVPNSPIPIPALFQKTFETLDSLTRSLREIEPLRAIADPIEMPVDRDMSLSVINVIQSLADGLASLDSISQADLRKKLEHAFQVFETTYIGLTVDPAELPTSTTTTASASQ